MKKFAYLIFFIFLFVGCEKTTLITTQTNELVDVTLINETGQVYHIFEDVETGSTLGLPEYTSEDYIFIGWQQKEAIYYKEYLVEEAATLSVVLEDPTLVFDYSFDNQMLNTYIHSYNGQAKYLTIPTYLEGIPVTSLSNNAFRELDLVEIYVPNMVQHIGQMAFSYMPNLEKISFYGNYGGYAKEIISQNTYQQIINENNDACNITEGTLSKGKFAKGCPIAETISSSEPITIGNQVYITYSVVFDLEFYEEFEYNLQLNNISLYDLPNLKTIELNSRVQHFNPGFLEKIPNLEIIKLDDNPYFEIVDGVLFSEDLLNLIYYPANKKGNTYAVPDTTQRISYMAFYENQNLETINIPSSVEKIESDAFYEMNQIQAINVAQEEYSYYSVNGIVFEDSLSGLILFYYPANYALSSYTVPDHTTSINAFAFNYNNNLEELILNEGLVSIGAIAFSYSKKLKTLNIPASVEFIAYGILLRSNVETLIINRSYYIHGSITEIVNLTVYNETPQIYVPDDSLAFYEENSFYSYITEFIYPLSEYKS